MGVWNGQQNKIYLCCITPMASIQKVKIKNPFSVKWVKKTASLCVWMNPWWSQDVTCKSPNSNTSEPCMANMNTVYYSYFLDEGNWAQSDMCFDKLTCLCIFCSEVSLQLSLLINVSIILCNKLLICTT